MDEDVRREMVNVMILALADGRVTNEEKRFIQSLRRKLGVSDAEFRDLVGRVRVDPKALPLSGDPARAAESVRLLTELAAADGQISHAERRLLEELARQAGVEDATAQSVIAAASGAGDVDESLLQARVAEIYASFAGWDAATRRGKLAELGSFGRASVVPLLRMLESYRVPDGADHPLELKALVAEQLGRVGDARAVFYLAQQINIGDVDDEATCAALRFASAEAVGQIVGQGFSRDQAGVEAARKWWFAAGAAEHDQLGY